MSVKTISKDELRRMEGSEGLILQGCGGNLDEWVDGINDMLTEDGILLNGTRFHDCSTFEHDGSTCLLFPFKDDVELDVGKLAMWRLQTHGNFGGTWLSDYVPNKLGGFISKEQTAEAVQKPDCPLIGQDGNIFNLMGIASRTLKQNGLADQAKKMCDRIRESGDYGKQAKVVHTIPATINLQEEVKNAHKQLRVAAYCRVSTKQEDQLNSYDVQRRAYTDKINGEPGWTMVGIYADKGITGTSVKKRDDFNRLMRHCKQGKVDMIITKSVARFARNTLDCLKHTRMLKEHNVDVYFEEQGIHSIQPGAEFYITIYGSIAQSESENISANVRWGKAQSAKEGNVPFHYKRFLGYRRGSDGKPEIDPEQAVVVKRIYERFLAGDSLATIANDLNTDGIPTPSGVGKWQRGTIESILTNEKYKGDAILNKTYIRDCLSKKVMINNGERPKYYVENNHPAIIDSATFGRVQEEMARRCGKRKVKQVGTKTEQGRYSSKYALTELLICGECGTPYRRCTWAANGKKKVVWRCINRLDYGKKYCHYSPSIEESVLQEAIMKAVMQTAKQNAEVLKTLKLHIGMGLSAGTTEDNSLDLQIRIAEIEAEFQKMLKAIAADNVEAFDEEKAKALMDEKAKLQIQLDRIADTKQKRENAKSRLDEIFTIIEALANHPISYDDQIVRQILESVIVESKEKIKVVFVGGLEVTQTI